MNIAKRISLVRKAKGLTIEEVSEKIGKSTYDRVETGKIELKFSELLAVCTVLDIKIWDLVAEKLIITYSES